MRRMKSYLATLLLLLLAACALPASGQPLQRIIVDGGQLKRGWQSFEVRGVDYVRVSGADERQCWTFQFGADPRCPWDTRPILADLDAFQRLGVNTIRIFLNYYVFGGQQKVDQHYDSAAALAHLDAFIDAANARGMYVLPVLLIDYPQDRFGPEHWEKALDLHVRPLVRHLAARDGIIAWDLFNEPDIGSPVDKRCWDWDNADFAGCLPLAEERLRFLKMLAAEVRQLDPGKPLTIAMAFAKSHTEPADAALHIADMVDIFTFHYYDNEPYDSGRYAQHWYYGKGFPADLQRALRELNALRRNKPIIVTEIGFPTGDGTTRTLADLRRDLRVARRIIGDESADGMLLWSFQKTPDELVSDVFR